MKSLKRIITLLSILLFVLSGCSFNQKFNISKTGKITIVIGSACRSADIDQLIKQKNAFLKIKIHGALEDSKIVKFERGASISFNNIPIDSEVYLEGYIFTEEISEDGESIKNVILYKGKSETVVIEPGDNKISLRLKSVGNDDSEIEISTGTDDNGQTQQNNGGSTDNGNTDVNSGNSGGSGNEENGGTVQNPVTGKIEIYMNSETELFAKGSQITFTAQNSEGVPIPADNISVEMHKIYMQQQMDPNLPAITNDDVLNSKDEDPDGCYTINKNENKYTITTAFEDANFSEQSMFYFVVYANDGNSEKRKKFKDIFILEGERTETVFSMSYDGDEIFADGSTVMFNATDRAGNPIPANKLKVEMFWTYYNDNPPYDLIEEELTFYNLSRIRNDLLLTTDVPNTLWTNLSSKSLYFLVTNIETSEKRKFNINLTQNTDLGIQFVITPKDGILYQGGTITISVLDNKLNLVDPAAYTIDDMYYLIKVKDSYMQQPVNTDFYTGVTENGYTTITLGELTKNQTYYIPVYMDLGELGLAEKLYTFTVMDAVVNETIDATGKTEAQITSLISDSILPVANSIKGGSITYTFTGLCNTEGMNLYSTVANAIFNSGISRSKDTQKPVSLTLDFSDCDGSSLVSIPAETFKEVEIITNLELSSSTKEIGDEAFRQAKLPSFDSYNVTTIGKSAFSSATITNTIDLHKVTVFGNQAGFDLNAGMLILGAAKEIYKTDNDHGNFVFQGSKITKIVADKLTRIDNVTFGSGTTSNFAIDSLMYIGSNCLTDSGNSNNLHYLYFNSPENGENWYGIANSIQINGEWVTSDTIAKNIYNKVPGYELNTILYCEGNLINGEPYYLKAIPADELISTMSEPSNGIIFFRIVP